MPVRALVCLTLILAVSTPVVAQDPPATQPSVVPRLLEGPATRPGDELIARFDRVVLTRKDFMDFLVQTRGLDALLNLMQFQIAKAWADEKGIRVTMADLEREQHETLRQVPGAEELTEDQYPRLLEQLLAQQQLSRAEFDIVMATNAYIKALARPEIDKMLTDENLRRAFNLRYGEQVRVRHIQLDSRAQLAVVKQRLDAGEDFAAVARDVSRNPESRPLGGLIQPFSMQSEVPQVFKEAAFALEVGQVSDLVESGDAYHLIKLEERIAPRAVQYEDVREELKKTVAEEQLLAVTSHLRRGIAQMLASPSLEVMDPLLAEQLRQRLAALRPQPMTQEPPEGPVSPPDGGPPAGERK